MLDPIDDTEIKQEKLKEIEDYCRRTKAITPPSIALKFEIKVSQAKKILRSLEEKGIVRYVIGNSKQKIYTPA